jgi:hypothetical protein
MYGSSWLPVTFIPDRESVNEYSIMVSRPWKASKQKFAENTEFLLRMPEKEVSSDTAPFSGQDTFILQVPRKSRLDDMFENPIVRL